MGYCISSGPPVFSLKFPCFFSVIPVVFTLFYIFSLYFRVSTGRVWHRLSYHSGDIYDEKNDIDDDLAYDDDENDNDNDNDDYDDDNDYDDDQA